MPEHNNFLFSSSVLFSFVVHLWWRKILPNMLYVTVCLWFEKGSRWHPGSCPLSVLGVSQLVARQKMCIDLEHEVYPYHLNTSEVHPETVVGGCGESSSATHGCIPRGFFRSSLREDQKRFANMVANTPNTDCSFFSKQFEVTISLHCDVQCCFAASRTVSLHCLWSLCAVI